MANETLLTITGAGVPPYSARGLQQTLDPIPLTANIRRTVNGGLINLSPTQFRKYMSIITCEDQQTPAVGGIWPGSVVTVGCVAELCHLIGQTPERTAVAGSTYQEDGYEFYRPELTMMVIQISNNRNEYGALTSWSITLEETG